MKNTKELNKLLNTSDRIQLVGNVAIKVTKKAKNKISNLWKKSIELAKANINKIKEKSNETKNFVVEKASDVKTNFNEFTEDKKQKFNNFMEDEINAAIEERNENLKVDYKAQSQKIFESLNELKKSNLDEASQKIYRNAAGKKLSILNDKYIQKDSSNLGVFALSKLTAKKLKVNAESKFKTKLAEIAAAKKAKKEQIKVSETQKNNENEKQKLEEMISQRTLLDYEINLMKEKLGLQKDSEINFKKSENEYTINEKEIVNEEIVNEEIVNEENKEVKYNLNELYEKKQKLEFHVVQLNKKISEMDVESSIAYKIQKTECENTLEKIKLEIRKLEENTLDEEQKLSK